AKDATGIQVIGERDRATAAHDDLMDLVQGMALLDAWPTSQVSLSSGLFEVFHHFRAPPWGATRQISVRKAAARLGMPPPPSRRIRCLHLLRGRGAPVRDAHQRL